MTGERLYTVLDADGYVLRHWRTTEADALHFVTINRLDADGNRLTGPTGLTIVRYPTQEVTR